MKRIFKACAIAKRDGSVQTRLLVLVCLLGCLSVTASAQNQPVPAERPGRPLVLNQARYRLRSGERARVEAAPETLDFLRTAKSSTVTINGTQARGFVVGPSTSGTDILLAASLTVTEGDYAITVSAVDETGEQCAQWGSHILVQLISSTRSPVYLNLGVDGRVLMFTAGIAILSGLLFGLAPAWRGTRVQPQSAMKANARGVVEGSKFGLGKALVTLQVALSLVLVTGAALMMSTFFKLSAVDTGFDRDRVLLVQVDLRKAGVPAERRSAAFEQIVDSFRAIPGVRSVSGSDNTPISGNTWSGDVAIDGDQSRSSASTHVYFN